MELTAEELEYLNSSEFELEGVKYKAVGVNKQDTNIPTCIGCAFDGDNIRQCMNSPQCRAAHRKDGREVIFVKVEDNVI